MRDYYAAVIGKPMRPKPRKLDPDMPRLEAAFLPLSLVSITLPPVSCL
jgi:hypothetical protein